MKTTILLLLGLLLLSCSAKELDEDCKCTKESYIYEQGTTTGVNGLPIMTFNKVTLSVEQVGCQDEQTETHAGNNVYFNIKCE